MNDTTKQEINSLDIIGFLWRNKKILIIVGVLAFIVSSIVSLMIEEKFESAVTLYPSKSSSVSFSEVITDEQGVSRFGEEAESEQMLQILESSKISGIIIKKYNLLSHYDIDTSGKYIYTELKKTYAENINFNRNNNGAVLIKVLDKSPDTAALIANDIAMLFDSTKNAMIHQRALTEFEIKKQKLNKLNNDMIALRDTMSKLTSLGVVTDEAYRALTQVLLSAKDKPTIDEYKQKLLMTEKYGSILKSFQVEVEFLSERIATMATTYEQAETDANSFPSHKFIVEKAVPAEKKTYPIRWLIVVMSSMATVLFFIVLILFRDKIKTL